MKALFLVIGNEQKVIESAKVIASFKQQNPFSRINLLVDESQLEMARNIKNIDQIHTINVNRIISLSSKRVFSDALVINQFITDLSSIKDITWDLVHNFSNSNVTAYILSFLKATKKTGAYFNNNHLLNHSNTWATILNTQVAKLDTTITQYTAHKHILGIEEDNLNIPFMLDGENLNAAQVTFKNLRGNLAPNTRVLGLTAFKNENKDQKIAIIEELINIGGHYPVIVTGQDEDNVAFATDINQQFEGALLQIEVDAATMPAVLLNVDLMITEDLKTLSLANSVDTPTITSQLSQLKTTSTSNIYYVVQDRVSNKLEEILNHFNDNSSHPLNNVTFSMDDNYGTTLITGDIELDIVAHIKRITTFASLGYPVNEVIKDNFLKRFNLTNFRNTLPKIKEELNKSLTIVLSAIRILKQYQNSDRHEKSFWAKLSQVFSLEKENIITRDFISVFCSAIYSIDTGIKEENLIQIETQLYALKNNIALINDTVQYFNDDERSSQTQPKRIITTNL